MKFLLGEYAFGLGGEETSSSSLSSLSEEDTGDELGEKLPFDDMVEVRGVGTRELSL